MFFGIGGDNWPGPSAFNCYSAGLFDITSTSRRTGLLLKNGATLSNCYYLDGIVGTTGLTAQTGETIFYKTSDNEEDLTTAKVVAALNNYIELKGVIEEGDTEVDTTGWCQWKVGKDNLPELDFDIEWKGTEWQKWNGTEWVAIND